MEQEQRIQIRVSKYLLAKVVSDKGSFFGYVQDLAKAGVGMSCNRELAINSKLEISLNVPERHTMQITGYPVWKRDLPVIARNKYIYGVKVPTPPEDFSNYVEELVKREYERRQNRRFSEILIVRSDDVLDLLDAATADVSAKGLYVRTGRLLVNGQQIEMQLSLPDDVTPITCLVEVVNSFTCQDDNLDHPYGAGVRIISFGTDGEQRFSRYLTLLDDLYKFHWPDGQAPEELEVKTEGL